MIGPCVSGVSYDTLVGVSLGATAKIRLVLVLWAAAALLCALTLYGYHQEDEFGQVASFALLKLGILDPSQMPWEYQLQVRPWLQPALLYGVFAATPAAAGRQYLIFERFALLLGFVFAMIGAWALASFARRAGAPSKLSYRWERVGVLASLWFLPSMAVRHSSEALSAALLCVFLRVWHSRTPTAQGRFTAGVLAGLAFWVRFHLGLFFLGFFIAEWFAFRGEKERRWLPMAFGFTVACAAGWLTDFWGYGAPVLTPWNYFHEQVLNDVASVFGREPWYWYFIATSAVTLNPLLWVWIGGALLRGWRDRYSQPLVVGLTVFTAVHLLVPHKELRFLIPMIPVVVVLFIRDALAPGGESRRKHGLGRAYARTVWAANLVVFVVFAAMGFRGPRNQAEYSLWKLPAGPSTVYSATDFYHVFDRELEPSPFTPDRVGTYQNALDGRFRKPRDVSYVYSPPALFGSACRADPEAYVLVSSAQNPAEMEAGLSVEEDFGETVSRFPPAWLPTPLAKVRTWKHQLIACQAYLEAAGDRQN